MKFYLHLKKLIKIFEKNKNKSLYLSQIYMLLRNADLENRSNNKNLLSLSATSNFLDYWTKKGILLKKYSIYSPKNKYMYSLSLKGIYLSNLIYPSILLDQLTYEIILPIDIVLERVKKIIGLNKINKKSLLNLLLSKNLFKIGKYYYVLVQEDREILAKIIPEYPYISYSTFRNILLKEKINQKFDLFLYKRFKELNYNLKLVDLSANFKIWTKSFILYKLNTYKKHLKK